jgi:HPt (histidine-containing phosphotransfer) domain-containing protein
MRIGQDENVDPSTGNQTDWWTANAPPLTPGPPITGPGWNGPTVEYPGFTNIVKNPTGVPPTTIEQPPPGPGPAPMGVPTSGFGAAPTPYASDPNAPTYTPLPTYTAPTWQGGDYKNPTEADLLASPGYQARLDASLQARNRSAAAQGTVLNGGTLKALDRTAQDYATNEYQTLRNNTYDAYVQKYKQFTDSAGMDLNARTVNANENQNTFANRTGSYLQGNARTLSDYLTNLTATRNSELDYWNRLQDVSGTGATLAGNSR